MEAKWKPPQCGWLRSLAHAFRPCQPRLPGDRRKVLLPSSESPSTVQASTPGWRRPGWASPNREYPSGRRSWASSAPRGPLQPLPTCRPDEALDRERGPPPPPSRSPSGTRAPTRRRCSCSFLPSRDRPRPHASLTSGTRCPTRPRNRPPGTTPLSPKRWLAARHQNGERSRQPERSPTYACATGRPRSGRPRWVPTSRKRRAARGASGRGSGRPGVRPGRACRRKGSRLNYWR